MLPLDPATATLGADEAPPAIGELVPVTPSVIPQVVSQATLESTQPGPETVALGPTAMAVALHDVQGMMVEDSGVLQGVLTLSGAAPSLHDVQDAVAVLNRVVIPAFEVSLFLFSFFVGLEFASLVHGASPIDRPSRRPSRNCTRRGPHTRKNS